MIKIEQIHNERINIHRERVEKYLKKFAKSELAKELDFSENDAELIAFKHDKDKCVGGAVYDQYCVISYLYHCKLNNLECDLEYTSDLDDATVSHIVNNSHHPEYWDDDFTPRQVTDFNDRDNTELKSVNGEKMDDEALIELAADWCATAEERGNTPQSWADKCRKDKRYVFTNEQWDFIYELLDIMKK